MQGELGTGIFVAAVAVAVVGTAIYAIANSDDEDTGADYETVCVDHDGNRVDDGKCPDSPVVSTSDVLDTSAAYGTAYVPTSSPSGAVIVIPGIGQRMTAGSYSFRTPTSMSTPGGGPSKPVKFEKPPVSGGAVQRGGFGVKSGSSGTGSGGTGKGGTSSGS